MHTCTNPLSHNDISHLIRSSFLPAAVALHSFHRERQRRGILCNAQPEICRGNLSRVTRGDKKQLDNGSFSGALGDLINKRADFMSNACFVKDYLTDNRLEFTNAINDDKLCIVVRTAALVCMGEERGEERGKK
jgi:hypothetical protein